MKLILEFTIKQNKFPIEFRRTFMHFLKTCISSANDGKYYNHYYSDTSTKDYTFAIFFDEPTFCQNEIELSSNRIKMIFSTPDRLSGLVFYSSFLEKKNKRIILSDDNEMELKNIMKITEPSIKNNKILVKMNSPLVIRHHSREDNKDYYFSVFHDNFESEAIRVITHQLKKSSFLDEYLVGFKITPIKCRKVIVTHYGCKIEATLGNFMLEGNPVVLEYLLKGGVGSRKSAGFGMMELLTEDI